jgi:hypothetical protein
MLRVGRSSVAAKYGMRPTVMEGTVPAKVPKRKVKDKRLDDFEDLADFVNLGDKPGDWANFRQSHSDFFPADITDWIYINAEVWWNLSNLPATRPDNYQEIIHKGLPGPGATITIDEWAKLVRNCRTKMPRLRPPLLFYRNLLRRVWRRKDPYGKALKELLGIDEAWAPVLEDGEEKKEDPLVYEEKGRLIAIPGHIDYGELFKWKVPEGPKQHSIGSLTWIDKKTETSSGLPLGTPVVSTNRGTINWEFGCQFQTAIYHLMQERWRAKICSWSGCRKYFVADKGARKYCSEKCCWERKLEQARDYQRRSRKARKQNSKAPQTRARRQKS